MDVHLGLTNGFSAFNTWKKPALHMKLIAHGDITAEVKGS